MCCSWSTGWLVAWAGGRAGILHFLRLGFDRRLGLLSCGVALQLGLHCREFSDFDHGSTLLNQVVLSKRSLFMQLTRATQRQSAGSGSGTPPSFTTTNVR